MKNTLLAGFIGLLMLSCQTIDITKNSDQCSQLDWFEVGRSAGLQGLPSDSYKERKVDCDEFKEDFAVSYGNGWYAGVDEFCTSENGFAFGRSGYDYKNICPLAKETAFLKAYVKGKKVFEYEKTNRQLTQQLLELGDSSAGLSPEETRKRLKKMNALETELELNKALIAEIQRDRGENAPQSQSF